MKIAFTTSGEALTSPLDGRFGRAPRLLIYDRDLESIEILDNRRSVEAAQGAGIQAAEAVVRAGANAVVTGHCGPKAFRVLSMAGIEVYTCNAATVAEALEELTAGRLRRAESADVEGHWS